MRSHTAPATYFAQPPLGSYLAIPSYLILPLPVPGKVVAILTPSPKREHVVGLLQLGASAPGVAALSAQPLPAAVAALQAAGSSSGSASTVPSSAVPTCYLMPLDPRLPRCVVRPSELKNLPTALLEELVAGPDKAENRWGWGGAWLEWREGAGKSAGAFL